MVLVRLDNWFLASCVSAYSSVMEVVSFIPVGRGSDRCSCVEPEW